MPAWLYSVNFSSPHPFPCEIWEKSWCWNLTLLKGLNETLSCFLHFSPYLVEFCLEFLHTRMLNNCELSTGQYSTEHTLGTGWRISLRHFATSRKVGGSFPDGVIGNFRWQNPSGRTMALVVDSASNRNECQEYFLVAKGNRRVQPTTLPPPYADCFEIWEPQPPGTLRACPGL